MYTFRYHNQLGYVHWVFQFEFTLHCLWYTNYFQGVQERNLKQEVLTFKVWKFSYTKSLVTHAHSNSQNEWGKKTLENVITGSREILKWMLDCSGRC